MRRQARAASGRRLLLPLNSVAAQGKDAHAVHAAAFDAEGDRGLRSLEADGAGALRAQGAMQVADAERDQEAQREATRASPTRRDEDQAQGRLPSYGGY